MCKDNSIASDEPLVERIAEEILARQRAGENPTVEEYCQRYPEHAEELRSFLPTILAVENLKPNSQDIGGSFCSDIHLGGQRRQCIGDYRLLRELGRGGMGVVYEAEQESLGRHVALKVFPKQSARDAKSAKRFESEARAAARLHHTNIVPVFDVGADDQYLFYAMQLIQGQALDLVIDDLKQLLDRGTNDSAKHRFPPKENGIATSLARGRFEQDSWSSGTDVSPSQGGHESQLPEDRETIAMAADCTSSAVLPGQSALSTADDNPRAYYESVAKIGAQTAQALSYAHARGIIHRDIKPSNLLLDGNGIVWITDFGLAKTGDHGLTHTGDVLGTIRYMSPERFGGQCDVRADVYSLGLTLYELLTLKPAFGSSDHMNLIERIKSTEPPSPRAIDSRVPRDLETIVLKSIDKDPKRRYQSADDLEADLQRFIDDEPIRARRVSLPERFVRWSRRNRSLAAALTVIFSLLTVGLVGSAAAAQYFRNQEQQQRQLADEEEQSRKSAEATAYRALVGEARALRLARQPDYRNTVWSQLKKALEIDTPERDIDQLREEAAACLGDFVGREPIIWNDLGEMPGLVAAFPDSQRIALALEGGILSIRLIDTNKETARFQAGGGNTPFEFTDLQVAPDGRHIVIADNRAAIEVWKSDETGSTWTCDVKYRALYSEGLPSGRPRTHVRIFPDSNRFSVASIERRNIGVLGLTERRADQIMLQSGRGVTGYGASVSPDGRRLAVAMNFQEVGIYDVATGELEKRFRSPLAWVYEVVFSPDGKTLCLAAQGGFATYDTETFSQKMRVRTDTMFSPVFSEDGRWLAFDTPSRQVQLWNLNLNREVANFDGPKRAGDSGLSTLAITPDGRRIVYAGATEVRIWRLDGQPEKQILKGQSNGVGDIAFSPDGQLLATTGTDKRVRLWNSLTGKLLHTLESDGYCLAVAFSPDGRLLASGGFGKLRLWDTATRRQLVSHRTAGGAMNLAFTPDGQTIVSSGFRGMDILDIARTTADDGEKIVKLQPRTVDVMPLGDNSSNSIFGISISQDGRWAAFTRARGHTSLWDLQENREVNPFPHNQSLMWAEENVSFLPDNRHVVFIANNGKPQVWDITTGKMAYEISRTRNFRMRQHALSHDGRWMVGAADADAATIIDVREQHELFTLSSETSAIKSIVWSEDGQRFALGLTDGDVVIWDFASVKQQLSKVGLGWE